MPDFPTDNITNTFNMDEIFLGLQSVCKYFERHSKANPLFIPEYKAAEQINSLIQAQSAFGYSDAVEIIRIINEVEKMEHYDGTGWFDYKIRLCSWLRANGFRVEHTGYTNIKLVPPSAT